MSWMKTMLNFMGYKVHVPEYIGYGKRKKEGKFFQINDSMDELNGQIASENGEVTIIGHSMGGAMALSIAFMNPNVKKVYAISAPNGKGIFEKFRDDKRLKGISFILNKDFKHIHDKYLDQYSQVMPNVNFKNKIDKQQEFYLIHCKNDGVVPVEEYEENVKMLSFDTTKTKFIKWITGIGSLDHFLLFHDCKTLNFVRKTINFDYRQVPPTEVGGLQLGSISVLPKEFQRHRPLH